MKGRIRLELTYKDKTYSKEELQQQYKAFADSIESHNDFVSYIGLAAGDPAYDKSYSMAIEKLYSLHELLGTAKFNLFNAFKKFHSDVHSSQESYISHLIRRSHYLKSAIVWYNSCEDYTYQIIWLAYDMHKIEMDSPESYPEALGNLFYRGFKEILEKNKSENAKKLLGIVKNYRCNSDVCRLRDIANNLKHRGNIGFKGIFVGRPGGYVELDEHGKVIHNSNWITPEVIDIDETIDLVKVVHNLLIKFVRDIVEFIDFKAALADDQKIVKEKSEYRKILL